MSRRRWICCYSLLLAALTSFPALSQPPVSVDPAAAAAIDPEGDRRIAATLRARYAQLDGLADVRVRVEAGIVRLSGEVTHSAAAERALELARRADGVAEVVDELSVARDLKRRLLPALAKLEARALDLVAFLPLLAVALIILLIFFFLARRLGRWNALYERLTPNPFLRNLLRQVVRAVVVIVGLVAALELLDATALVSAVLGTAGVLGLAVGFAFRDLVENYIASVLLSLRQPFAPNDHVQIGSHAGKVIRLTSRATILMTLDGNHLRIPNADVFKGVVLNTSRNPLRRFDFAIGVGVDVDLIEAQRLGLEILSSTPGVIADPAAAALVQELGDSTVQVRFYAWVDQREASLSKVKGEAIRRVKTALEDADIDMPEPTYRLRLDGATATLARDDRVPPAVPPRRGAALDGELPADISAGDDVDRQIAAERTAHEEDLLDRDAQLE